MCRHCTCFLTSYFVCIWHMLYMSLAYLMCVSALLFPLTLPIVYMSFCHYLTFQRRLASVRRRWLLCQPQPWSWKQAWTIAQNYTCTRQRGQLRLGGVTPPLSGGMEEWVMRQETVEEKGDEKHTPHRSVNDAAFFEWPLWSSSQLTVSSSYSASNQSYHLLCSDLLNMWYIHTCIKCTNSSHHGMYMYQVCHCVVHLSYPSLVRQLDATSHVALPDCSVTQLLRWG